MAHRFTITLLSLGILFASCGGGEDLPNQPDASSAGSTASKPESQPSESESQPTETPGSADEDAISAEDRKSATTHFAALCTTCHGTSGKGDGPTGAALTPKPRDWTDAAWQASVTDQELAEVILKGGSATGLSPLMPGSMQFKDRPGVIDALVEIVRDFGE